MYYADITICVSAAACGIMQYDVILSYSIS